VPITRLNHAVLYVRDVARTTTFYCDLLGFRVKVAMGAQAGPSGAGRTTVGLYHLAWEVDTLDELVRLRDVLRAAGALVGASDHGTTKALYCHDPDGLEFEVCWLLPADLITPDISMQTRSLDLDGEIARYGGQTRGGIGVSWPAPV
jgi:catechol-2,3-dioxygenase